MRPEKNPSTLPNSRLAERSPCQFETRRGFRRNSALLAAAAWSAPALIPASALGRDGAVAPSKRILLGGIGRGGRGTGVPNWMLPEKDVRFVAICGARQSQQQAIKCMVDAKYGSRDCATYQDIREFPAARTEIDAVLIATGDRSVFGTGHTLPLGHLNG